MFKSRASFLRYFQYLLFAIAVGAILIAYANYSSLKTSFSINSKEKIRSQALKLSNQLDESLIYIENLTNVVATRIINHRDDPQFIATILKNVIPKIDDKKYDIFTWTFFNFIDPQNQVVATSGTGVMDHTITIHPHARTWVHKVRQTPWKFHISKSALCLINGEPTIPVGLGITDKQGEFVGSISFGINIEKLNKMLEKSLDSSITSYALLNADNSIATASKNFNQNNSGLLQQELNEILRNHHQDLKNNFIKIGNREFFYAKVTHYPQLSIITEVDHNVAHKQLLSEILPTLLNTIYLTIFFLVLLLFFRKKLLNPIMQLAEAAQEISQGKTDITIPQSKIYEVNALAQAIETVKVFVAQQKEEKTKLRAEKLSAEKANHNQNEFVASTAHELRNFITGIVGLAEIVKNNFSDKLKLKNHNFTPEEIAENSEFINDIINLSGELQGFIRDLTDINQAQSGDFKIEEHSSVDTKDIILRSVKLLRTRAAKSNKEIITKFIPQNGEDFTIDNLDPVRLKQILVNLISNSIKYASDNTKIELTLERIEEEAAKAALESMVENVKNNPEIGDNHKIHLLNIIRKSRPKIIITIKDQGPGMSPEELKIAMEKYGRIKSGDRFFIDSTGLGLPIVKHLVEMQGGRLLVSSEKGVGTEIRVIF